MLLLYFSYFFLVNYVTTNVEGISGNFSQKWGYTTVRPGAHLFWWLYYTTANVTSYTERPLIIWLQGGPGLSSSCTGNFLEIGPLDVYLKPRKHSWVQEFNVLFIDNPVGSGFSYFSQNDAKFATSNEEVTDDLISFAQQFYRQNPEFQKVPLYIFGQSFGAKFAVELSARIHEVSDDNLEVTLKGVGLMGGYVSPLDTLNSYRQLGLALGILDNKKSFQLKKLTREIKLQIANNNTEEANSLEMGMFRDIFEGCSIYNLMDKTTLFYDNMGTSDIDNWNGCNRLFDHNMLEQMNTTSWTYHNVDVLAALIPNYYVPVTDKIEYLLNNTDVKVMVFSGMFDFIVNLAGTVAWMNKLKWHGGSQWKELAQTVVEIDNVHEAFVRKTDQLVLYIITQAGHSIPIGNSKAMLEILRREIFDGKL